MAALLLALATACGESHEDKLDKAGDDAVAEFDVSISAAVLYEDAIDHGERLPGDTRKLIAALREHKDALGEDEVRSG